MFRVLLLYVVIGFCCINSSKCDFVDLPVAELCFSCICRASGCVLSCDSRECGPFRITKEYWMASGNWTYNNHPPEAHQSGELCGPFGITKNYWLEANSPTVHRVASTDPAAFETCIGSAFCNYFVLQRYMEKYKKDCNGDGKIDCDDFAAILRLGPKKCDGELPENYQDRYDYCQALVQD
ncbi:hypothetical protein RN001_007214 [Aquatica leii]|uniref:lysozyme n=1 Tax=Aquatica leii TaxID=1421715 RepID=A0AAN7P999_9COLE|nr:hypothetical protein RN001_007214 [Aquatica leii]